MELNKLNPLSRLAKNKVVDYKGSWDKSKKILKFRKFPWPHWIMGFLWMFGTVWLIWEIGYDKLQFKEYAILKEYTALAFCFIMGLLFCYKGKVRTVVFDKKEGTLTLRKKNTFCDRRALVTYQLRDIRDARAVHRNYKSGGVNL